MDGLAVSSLVRTVANSAGCGLTNIGGIEQAALKCVYIAVMSPDPTGQGRNAGLSGGKQHNAFEGHLSAARR